MLLDHGGVNVNKTTMDDEATPLFIACVSCHSEVVRMLLDHGDIEVTNEHYIRVAAMQFRQRDQINHMEILRMLLKHSASNKTSNKKRRIQ
jgi:ankyrin repeat protein